MKRLILLILIASTAGCVVEEERGPRGRTVVEHRGHGHAYGHDKHHR